MVSVTEFFFYFADKTKEFLMTIYVSYLIAVGENIHSTFHKNPEL